VRDDDHRALGGTQRVHPRSHDPQRVDVQPRIGLVQDCERRLQDRHLEDLVSLLLAAGKSFVDRATDEILVDLDELRHLLRQLEKVDRVELGLAAVLADRVEGVLQEIDVGDARDLDGVLKGEEDALPRADLRHHREQVPAPVEHGALRDFVAGPAGEHVSQRGLARSVRAHDRVHLAGVDREVHPFEDFVAPHGNVEVLDFEHRFVHRTCSFLVVVP
jgi:hypothetical protein